MELRRAQAADARDVFDWRNDPATRAASLSTAEVDWQTHQQWFGRALENPRLVMYLAEQQAEPQLIGMCRFDINEAADSAEVSINLNPLARGQRLAQPLLDGAIRTFSLEYGAVHELSAQIRAENQASRLIFERAGFVQIASTDGVGVFRRAGGAG